MYRKCTTERSAQHQKQVERALLELMQKMPYEDITVTALCQTAGVTRRVFYHLFSNKTDALYALLDHTVLESESFRPEVPDQALRFFLYWKDRGQLLDALRKNQLTGLLLERMLEVILSEDYDIRRWLKACDWESGQDVLVFTLCGAMGMTCNWYYSGCPRSPEEMAVQLTQLLNGVSPAEK